MTKLFTEEQNVLDSLLAEWYEEIKSFTQQADGIFSEKGKMYDRTSPVWERIEFPLGFLQEIRKKTNRLGQLLGQDFTDGIKWDEVLEELGDVFNYARMLGALVQMHLARRGEKGTVDWHIAHGDGELKSGVERVKEILREVKAQRDAKDARTPLFPECKEGEVRHPEPECCTGNCAYRTCYYHDSQEEARATKEEDVMTAAFPECGCDSCKAARGES